MAERCSSRSEGACRFDRKCNMKGSDAAFEANDSVLSRELFRAFTSNDAVSSFPRIRFWEVLRLQLTFRTRYLRSGGTVPVRSHFHPNNV